MADQPRLITMPVLMGDSLYCLSNPGRGCAEALLLAMALLCSATLARAAAAAERRVEWCVGARGGLRAS